MTSMSQSDTLHREWLDGELQLDVAGPVATVTLANPRRRNAQHPGTWLALVDIGRAVPASARVVVLRAEGPSFCAGLDRRMLSPEGVPGQGGFATHAQDDDAAFEARIASFQEAFTWFRRPDILSVAAVQGHAVGAGFQLALACDLRVAAADAQFSMRETTLGLVPDLGGSKILTEIVGYSRALEICVTGRWVEAAEAERLGLVNAVVPAADLPGAVETVVSGLLAAPRNATVETKALLLGAAGRDHAAQRAAERQAQVRCIRELVGRTD